nr:MAG: hypothetical protein DIU80_05640 [Chloroflexota bacterium]
MVLRRDAEIVAGELHTHISTTVRATFVAEWLSAASLTSRMEQLNAECIQHGEEHRFSQEGIDQVTIVVQQTMQA